MAVEKIEKLVNAQFVFTPRKVTKTIFFTSDKTEFDGLTSARKYDKEYLLMNEFQKVFSEEKSNFKIGTKELNEALFIPEGNIFFEDCFWVKLNNEQEKILENFCRIFYKLGFENYINKEDSLCVGWIYITVIKNSDINGTYWVSKEQLENIVKSIKNNFPENIKSNVKKNKKVNKFEMMDI